MTSEFINKTLGIREAYQMPERMMRILEKAAERFLKHAERVQDSATQDIPEVKEG